MFACRTVLRIVRWLEKNSFTNCCNNLEAILAVNAFHLILCHLPLIRATLTGIIKCDMCTDKRNVGSRTFVRGNQLM